MTNDGTDAATDFGAAAEVGTAAYRVESGTDEAGAAVAIVHVSGELDAHGAEALTQLLDEGFASRPAAVVADLAGLGFMDSVGIGVLVAAHTKGLELGVPFQVHNVAPACLKVLEITQLTDVLDLH